VRALLDAVVADPTAEITVDLESQLVSGGGVRESFEIDPYTRWRLLEGVDDIGLTLRHAEAIEAFERGRPMRLPSVARA
jgi:3-isopropylmalate/(R)-2-methylmalate dehydratase small subunit